MKETNPKKKNTPKMPIADQQSVKPGSVHDLYKKTQQEQQQQ